MLGSYMHLVAQHHQQQYDIPTYFFHINFLFLIFVPILNVSTKTVFLPILVVGFSARLAHRLLQLSLSGLFLLNRGIEELFGVIAAHLVLILLVLVRIVLILVFILIFIILVLIVLVLIVLVLIVFVLILVLVFILVLIVLVLIFLVLVFILILVILVLVVLVLRVVLEQFLAEGKIITGFIILRVASQRIL